MKLLRSFSILLVLAIVVSSCGNKKNGVQTVEIADKSKIFKVEVVAQIRQDDVLFLYYTTDNSINFNAENAVYAPVVGSPDLQTITFEIPDKIPTQLRIDFGKNTGQPEITLSKINLSYNGKQTQLPSTLIFSYFRPDFTKTEFNAATGKIHGKLINGKKSNPSLYPKEGPLEDIISNLTKQ